MWAERSPQQPPPRSRTTPLRQRGRTAGNPQQEREGGGIGGTRLPAAWRRRAPMSARRAGRSAAQGGGGREHAEAREEQPLAAVRGRQQGAEQGRERVA